MDKEQAINLAKRYKEMVAEKLPLKALYLYGSYKASICISFYISCLRVKR